MYILLLTLLLSLQAETATSTTQNTESELAMLKQSLKILESMHESVRILDSDSDSDSDECDGRYVVHGKITHLKLALVIGSQHLVDYGPLYKKRNQHPLFYNSELDQFYMSDLY